MYNKIYCYVMSGIQIHTFLYIKSIFLQEHEVHFSLQSKNKRKRMNFQASN